MTREGLREQIATYLAEALRGAHLPDPAFWEMADRILALIPAQPKLEWRLDDPWRPLGALYMGNFCVGHVFGAENLLFAWVEVENPQAKRARGPFTQQQEARAAVEEAVRKALGLVE